MKVACQRSLISPRNRPTLVALLCIVIGWDQPEESDTGGGSQITAAGVSFASHSWRFARWILMATPGKTVAKSLRISYRDLRQLEK